MIFASSQLLPLADALKLTKSSSGSGGSHVYDVKLTWRGYDEKQHDHVTLLHDHVIVGLIGSGAVQEAKVKVSPGNSDAAEKALTTTNEVRARLPW